MLDDLTDTPSSLTKASRCYSETKGDIGSSIMSMYKFCFLIVDVFSSNNMSCFCAP